MGVSTTDPMEWMLHDGTGKSTVYKGDGGWYRKHADGRIELIQSMNFSGGGDVVPDNPTIVSVTNPPDGTYTAADAVTLMWKVRYDEAVVVDTAGGVPAIPFQIGGVDVAAVYDEKNSTEVELAFVYITEASTTGTVTNVGGASKAIDLKGGTIKALDDPNLDAPVAFPTDWTAPTITIA